MIHNTALKITGGKPFRLSVTAKLTTFQKMTKPRCVVSLCLSPVGCLDPSFVDYLGVLPQKSTEAAIAHTQTNICYYYNKRSRLYNSNTHRTENIIQIVELYVLYVCIKLMFVLSENN